MDKTYNQTETEEKWYKFWEEKGYFKPEVNPEGQPYTIILPPPNANADLHFGHAMYTVEDILIRYHRMKGSAALWLPGADHAGFETQVVYEKHLQSEGKSRFDFDRETLYKNIWDFVQKNKSNMENQLKRLGFSVDWSREKFTLDEDIIKVVYKTFKKLFDSGLVYRASRLVNYCTFHGTSFSDLEVIFVEKQSKLYFIKYPLEGGGAITVASTRPETMFGDVAVAVNPQDERYNKLLDKKITLPLSKRPVPIIADPRVEVEFGTGAVKITPAHDPLDHEIGKANELEPINIINFDGTLNEQAGKYAGLTVKEARKVVVEDLESEGLLEKIEDYTHRVGTCYKCGTEIEPLLLEQWFIKVEPLAKEAMKVVKSGEVNIYPKNFTKTYFQWMEGIKDWNISRQIVWGMRIPAWYCNCNSWTVTDGEAPKKCGGCGSNNLEQDPDVFDTWFSSGQWPYATLQTTKPGDFDKFYPTSVMETGRDILFFWVARMIMLGLYNTGKIPFKDIVLHGTVLDPLGKKMSKSKGNVVNPIEIADQYGADAARMALVFGTAFGHDQSLSHPKLQAMRNFTNKLWNIGRYIIQFKPESSGSSGKSDISGTPTLSELPEKPTYSNKEILEKLDQTIDAVTKSLEEYRFHDGAEALYEFIWHEFADKYIESTKEGKAEAQPVLEYVYKTCLELLHPFMPFITEELWQRLPHKGESIMVAKWPVVQSD